MQPAIECEKCGDPTKVYDEEATIAHTDMSLDDHAEIWLMWKPDDAKHYTFYVCLECRLLYVRCDKCDEMLHFVGHMGFSLGDEEQHMRNSKTGVKTVLGTNAKTLERNKPRFDISDMNQEKFNFQEWLPCGPDDTYKHFWDCEHCKTHPSFSWK